MEGNILDKYRKAGEIARKVRDLGLKEIKPEVKILDVVEKIERRMYELGGEPAFPVNISINNIAAHFTPRFEDKHLIFKQGDVVKIDVGVHVEGYIADTAVTVELETDRYRELISSSKEALDRIIEVVKSGVEIGTLGKLIAETIESKGFKPIRNLSGHSLDRYLLHAGVSIPNTKTEEKITLGEGMVIAVEPFASTGTGYVRSRGWSNIYRYIHSPVFRDLKLRYVAKRIKERFKTLPFADRWFVKDFPSMKESLDRLISLRCIYHYPMLVDDGVVSQHEHTIIIDEDGCEVIT